MITSIKIFKSNKRFAFSDHHNFKFKPGLNLILGANTCGKTSLLNIIKQFNCYEPFDMLEKDVQLLKNYPVKLDNLKKQGTQVKGKISKVLEYKPQELHESYDLRLMQTDLKTALLSKYQSKGQGRTSYHDWFSQYLTNNAKFREKDLETIEELKIPYEKGFMILSDEPENSLAINMQFGLFDWFYQLAEAYKEHCQIIIATHSIAAFTMVKNPNVNIIEMNEGWVDMILDRVREVL